MRDAYAILHGARWSELIFGVVMLLMSLGLPLLQPDGRALLLLVDWYGMVAVALGLAVALRRPSQATWAVAAGLSAYFLLHVFTGFRGWISTLQWLGGSFERPGVLVSNLIAGVAVVTQLDVAFRCWRARMLWTERSLTADDAPPAQRWASHQQSALKPHHGARRLADLDWYLFTVVAIGVVLPYAVRVPGMLANGRAWLDDYFVGPAFLVNLIPVLFLVLLRGTGARPGTAFKYAVWCTYLFLGLLHSILDLSADALMGVALFTIPLFAVPVALVGYLVGLVAARWDKPPGA